MSDLIKTDVLVVGAGPAGSVAARHAAAKGADVTIVERRSNVGVPVRCGEFMPSFEEIVNMFPIAANMEDLFDIPENLRLRTIEGIQLVNPKMEKTLLDFSGYTTDRDRFDQYLVSRAEEEGAKVIKSCAFEKIENGHAITSEGEIEYKVIIGADGPGSKVAQELNLPSNKNPYPAVTAQAKGDFEPYIHMFFGGIAPGAYSWIIPKDGQANIGVGFSPKFANGNIHEYFDIFTKKHGFDVISEVKGKFVPSEGPVANTVSGNGMLVGDAAGHVISVNGGGIPLALIAGHICGDVAGDNILSGKPLSIYQDAWRSAMLKPLKTAAFNKGMADTFAFGSDWRTGVCMSILGKRRMGNLIRCKSLFP